MTARRRIDLNLFRVFDAVMLQGSVAGAARQLQVTPSAVSHSLARLRAAFRDPLFTPSETGMSPTERARSAHPVVSAALAQLVDVLGQRPFDPARSSRVFTVAATYYGSVIVLPALIRSLASAAPGIGLVVAPCESSRVAADLLDGTTTLAIGRFGRLDSPIRRETLFTDDEVVICRPEHQLCQRPVTWEQALRFPSIRIQGHGSEEVSPSSAAAHSRSAPPPRAKLVVFDEAPISSILEDTDLIATGPRRLALRAKGRLSIVEPTDRRAGIETEIVWHRRAEDDAGAQWLIAHIRKGASGLEAA